MSEGLTTDKIVEGNKYADEVLNSLPDTQAENILKEAAIEEESTKKLKEIQDQVPHGKMTFEEIKAAMENIEKNNPGFLLSQGLSATYG